MMYLVVSLLTSGLLFAGYGLFLWVRLGRLKNRLNAAENRNANIKDNA